MGRGSTVALAAAAAALLVSLPMLLLVSLPATDPLPSADPYEQESRRVFVEWKAKNGETYTYAGEEECRYAVFKDTHRRVAWNRAAWDRAARLPSSRLNGFAANSIEEMYLGRLGPGVAKQQEYEQETRRMFVLWKAKYGKTYRDVGEERCRYRLFMGNRRVVVRLNAATGQDVYGLNQFGDLTNEEVQQRCYPETDRELSARCQAAVLDPGSSPSGPEIRKRLISYMLLRRDEAMLGMSMKPRRPRAVVLCPTRELTEQVYRVAKSMSHHAPEQVLEPSLAKGNKVMVFCNTLNSSRAVDHFLNENQISTVNYHGEVPAEERVENLNKFRKEEGDCPTLVCTDLAARGLDLDVDHVIMFDFPSNSIDYLHRTGRTARMGAKGKVTSLVAKKDVALATRIEEAIKKNESLEALTTNNVRRANNPRSAGTKGRTSRSVKTS